MEGAELRRRIEILLQASGTETDRRKTDEHLLKRASGETQAVSPRFLKWFIDLNASVDHNCFPSGGLGPWQLLILRTVEVQSYSARQLRPRARRHFSLHTTKNENLCVILVPV